MGNNSNTESKENTGMIIGNISDTKQEGSIHTSRVVNSKPETGRSIIEKSLTESKLEENSYVIIENIQGKAQCSDKIMKNECEPWTEKGFSSVMNEEITPLPKGTKSETLEHEDKPETDGIDNITLTSERNTELEKSAKLITECTCGAGAGETNKVVESESDDEPDWYEQNLPKFIRETELYFVYFTKHRKAKAKLFKKIGAVWAEKLGHMLPSQQQLAETYVNDILFHGILGHLTKTSVQIEIPPPPPDF